MSGSIISQPSVSVAIANADQDVQNTPQRVLMVGQKTSAGSATAGALNEQVLNNEDSLFGANSMLAAMVRAFRKVNPVVRIDAIALDDAGGGTARVLDFTVAGTATASGTIVVVAGSEVNHRFEVAISSGDDPTAIGNAITAAINADGDCPFTCSNVAGAVTLTADNAGAVANDLGVEVEVDAAGVSVASLTETTAGATDPTLTGVLDVATERYQAVVWPYSDYTVLQSYLTPRFNATNSILDGVGFVTALDTFANVITLLDAENDQNLVIFCQEAITETLYLGPAMNEAGYIKTSIFAGIRALRLTSGQVITRFLTSSASLDQFGGSALASLPYFNTPLTDLPVVKQGRGWTQVEIESILSSGGSVLGVNPSGNTALVGEVATTYKTDPASNVDVTYKFLNYVDTASQAREYFHNNLRARFAQTRLTEGDVTRGRDMANDTVIGAYLDKLYQDLAGPDFVLVQDGEAAIQYFKDNRSITIDLSLGKVTITMLVPIVTQLREIIATMKISFSTQS